MERGAPTLRPSPPPVEPLGVSSKVTRRETLDHGLLAFDLLQGAGIAAAIGIRPFLPVLLVGALAAGDLGIDFDGTDFAFLEQAPLLAIVAGAAGALDLRRPPRRARRARGPAVGRPARHLHGRARAALGAGVDGRPRPPDRRRASSSGALCAALGFVVGARPADRARASASTPRRPTRCTLYAEGAGLLAAGVSVLFPPLAVLVIGGLLALLLGGRRRAGEKYAGLRILR